MHEAFELRDEDGSHFLGRGVEQAVANVNDVMTSERLGCDTRAQTDIDALMGQLDGTPHPK